MLKLLFGSWWQKYPRVLNVLLLNNELKARTDIKIERTTKSLVKTLGLNDFTIMV